MVDPNSTLSGTGGSSTTSATQTDPVLASIQSSLLGQSNLISSDNSNIQDTINKAIQGTQNAGTNSDTATNLDFQSQEQTAAQQGQQSSTQVQEASRGYAVNTGLLQNITKTTNDQIANLELKKQEALASGDATTAQNIASLQMQGMQFQQQAQQQVFANLLSVGNFMVSSASSAQAQQAQTFQEKQAISSIALQYGLTVQPGDTIDSITQRAQPFASQEQQMQLKQQQAAINASNAQTQAALASAAQNQPLSSDDITAIANAYLTGGSAVLGTIKDTTTLANVINKASDLQNQQYVTTAQQDQQQGVTKEQAQSAIANNQNLSATEQAAALAAIEKVYGATPPAQPNGVAKYLAGLAGSLNADLTGQTQIGIDKNGNAVYGQKGQKVVGTDSGGNPIIK